MPDPAKDDDQLIASAATGDRAAFAILVDRHGRSVLAVARALGARDADAEDVAQETFTSALEAAASYRPGVSSVRTWLFAIARNAARRLHRRDREVPAGVGDDVGDEVPLLELGIAAGWGHEPADIALDRVEGADRLARAIASLAPDDRAVLILRDVERLAGDEAAAALGLTAAAMKSRLHRARLRLMAALRESEGGIVANERDVGGLTCSAVLERLGDYVDGELPAVDLARIDAHLRGCTICERFGGRYARTVHEARDRLGLTHVIDDDTVARVRRALET